MNKKGFLGFDIPYFIPKIFFLVIVVLSIVFIVRGFVVTQIDTRSAEGHILINRMIYSPNGIIYYDTSIDRYYPGIIDLNNFNTERLEKTISASDYIGAKLTLLNKNKTVFYNEAIYNKYFFQTTVKEGGAKEISTKLYILIRENEKLSSDILNVSVVVR